MNKKRILTLVLAALFVTSIFTSSVFAGGDGGDGGSEGCTPGFWKNHVDIWPGGYNAGLYAMLTARGPGSGLTRHTAAAMLNMWSGIDYGDPEYWGGWDQDTLEWMNERGCPLSGRASKPPADNGS